MRHSSRRLPGLLGVGALAASMFVLGASSAAASDVHLTCSGGSVPGGAYRSLTVTGTCYIDDGNVQVERNVVVTSTGVLTALFAGANLTVGHDLVVNSGGMLAMGCDPVYFECFDESIGISHDSVANNLVASGAVLMLVHDDVIGGEVAQSGGGGGFGCAGVFNGGSAFFSEPAVTDYANNWIGGDSTVTGLRTCMSRFSRNHVGGSVNFNDNQTASADGNLVDGNVITGNLACFNDVPPSSTSRRSSSCSRPASPAPSGLRSALSS